MPSTSSADAIANQALQQLLVRRRRKAGKTVPAKPVETAEGRVEKAARRKKAKVETRVDKETAYKMSVKALKKDTKKFDEAVKTRQKIFDIKSGKGKKKADEMEDDDSDSD